MAIYVIGDIQGCYEPLRRLLASARFHPAHDRLWCVGDLINRGPRSLDTLRYLQDLGDSVTVVLGNHDLHFLSVHYGDARPERKHTLDELLAAPDCETLADWLRKKPLAHHEVLETDRGEKHYLMVHAGVAPQWTREKTLALATEVATELRGTSFREFLRHMYGNEPGRWDESLSGYDRLRVITNYLTRLRFCDARGNMNLPAKGPPTEAPDGYRPWYEFEQLTPETEILFGHWAALQGATGRPGVHGLDTGCVWGRQLSMMRLPDHKVFSVPGS